MEPCVQFKEQIHENSGFRFDPDKVKGGHQETMQSYLVVEKCREQGFSELLTPIVNGPKEAKDLQHLTLCVIIMLILWNCLRCLQRAMQRMKLLQRMMQMIEEERTQSNLNHQRPVATFGPECFAAALLRSALLVSLVPSCLSLLDRVRVLRCSISSCIPPHEESCSTFHVYAI